MAGTAPLDDIRERLLGAPEIRDAQSEYGRDCCKGKRENAPIYRIGWNACITEGFDQARERVQREQPSEFFRKDTGRIDDRRHEQQKLDSEWDRVFHVAIFDVESSEECGQAEREHEQWHQQQGPEKQRPPERQVVIQKE